MSIKLEVPKDCEYHDGCSCRSFDLEKDPTHEFSAENIFQRALDEADPNTRTVKHIHDELINLVGTTASLLKANDEHARKVKILLAAISEKADRLITEAGSLMRPLRECRKPCESVEPTTPEAP